MFAGTPGYNNVTYDSNINRGGEQPAHDRASVGKRSVWQNHSTTMNFVVVDVGVMLKGECDRSHTGYMDPTFFIGEIKEQAFVYLLFTILYVG